MKKLILFFAMQMAAGHALASTKVEVNQHWLQLLHYKKSSGSYRSQVDSNVFFLDVKNGPTDPAAELMATEKGFTQAAQNFSLAEAENPFCRFPGRYRWFKKYFPEQAARWPVPVCPKFDNYLKTLSGDSISLVFSSYYLNNPSSAFGHSFLRINKKRMQDGERYELLDYGVNYAADVDTSNPLMYMWKGLTGGFPGSFTSLPYYFKVREYNNAESRDLWEYELNVDENFVEFFIAHLWEVGPAKISYYYLSENCSYWVLALLDAIEPGYQLTSRLKSFVIPSDTIRLAWETPGLIKGYRFRPSIHTEFMTRLSFLNEIEKEAVLKIHQTENLDLADFNDEQKKNILDTALDYQDFKHQVDVQKPDSEASQFKNKILAARSAVGLKSEYLNIQPDESAKPHLGHGSRRFSSGLQASDKTGSYFHFQYRFALHDQLDPLQGYPAYAEITFGEFDFSFSQKKSKLELDKFTLFEVLSANTYNRFERTPAWRIRVGIERTQVFEKEFCHASVFDLGSGYATEVGRVNLFGGVKFLSRWMPSCNNKAYLGAGPHLRMFYRASPQLAVLLEGQWTYDTEVRGRENREITASAQWSQQNKWGIRPKLIETAYEKRVGIDGVFYY